MTHVAALALHVHGATNLEDALLQTHDFESSVMGRKLSVTPQKLAKRILYIPEHNDKVTTHLPIYNFAEDYHEVIGDKPIGSSRFKTTLGLMRKPTGDGRTRGGVEYLVDFAPVSASSGRATHITVTRRAMGSGHVEIGMTLPADAQQNFEMQAPSYQAPLPVQISHPIEPTVMRAGRFDNPWFTFTLPSVFDDYRVFQWQIHPVEHGLLRYTLVEMPESAAGIVPATTTGQPPQLKSAAENEDIVRAVYHNVGVGFSLVQPYSEGVLLMTDDLEPEVEALTVSSLLGLLWQARRLETETSLGSSRRESTALVDKSKTGKGHSRRDSKGGLLGRVFGRRKTSLV